MAVQRIQPDGLSSPPTYSQVVKAGNTLYIAGQVAQNERGEVVSAGDFVAQANQVFESLATALAAAGVAMDEARGAATAMGSHSVQGKERLLAAAVDDLDE